MASSSIYNIYNQIPRQCDFLARLNIKYNQVQVHVLRGDPFPSIYNYITKTDFKVLFYILSLKRSIYPKRN